MVTNILKRLLAANEPSFILEVGFARTTDIVGIAAASGHHAISIDLRRASPSLDCVTAICRAGLAQDVTPLVRASLQGLGAIGPCLEGGAQGAIISGIASAEDAEMAVRSCRFPPRGTRSTTNRWGPHTRHEHFARAKLYPRLDQETLVICALGSVAALDRAEEIVAVDGVDAVTVDLQEVAAAMGLAGQVTHGGLAALVGTAIAAAKRSRKPLIAVDADNIPALLGYIKMGAARCYWSGNDADLLLQGATQRNAALRQADESGTS